MNTSSRKRKFEELDDNKDTSSTNTTPNKRHKLNNHSSLNNKLRVKKTFARNRKRNQTNKHLNKSIPEEISDSDTDFDPISYRNNNKKNRKYSPLKLSKKIQSTLDFPIIKPSTNINKSTFNKCGPSKCSDCGMLYYIGRDEDDSIHSKFHKKYMDKFEHGYKPLLLSKYIIWNYESIAKNAPYFVQSNKNKYKQMKLILNGQNNKSDKNRCDLILCIKYNEYIELKNKNIDILSCVDMMDRELGYFTTKQLKNNGYKNRYKDIVYSLDEHQSLYCFVEKTAHKIVGCIVCEPREYAYKIKIKINDNGNNENVERYNEKQRCYIGVVKIWVHNKYRRQCIASLLMDCMRKHFIYGTEINKKYIAFCQPTRMGQQFAQKYCHTKHVLVY